MYIPITFEPDYANTISGIWCDDCNLPSVVRVPVLMFSESGVGPAGEVISCVNCDDMIELEDGDDGQLVGY